jgi:hypothetical protein
VRTDAAGRAQAEVGKARTAMKLRARWAGSPELAAATSNKLTVR